MADDSWRTPTFRQSVVSKIDEAIRQSRMPTSRNSMEMENHVFQKAKSKEEYLGFVARLILHVREMNQESTVNQVFDYDNWFNWSKAPIDYKDNKPTEFRIKKEQLQECDESPWKIKEVDEHSAFSGIIIAKLREMENKQRIICEHIINEVFYKAFLGELSSTCKIITLIQSTSMVQNNNNSLKRHTENTDLHMNQPKVRITELVSLQAQSSASKTTTESDPLENTQEVTYSVSKQFDELDAFGIIIAAKLTKINKMQKLFCEHIINEACYKGMLGELVKNMAISMN